MEGIEVIRCRVKVSKELGKLKPYPKDSDDIDYDIDPEFLRVYTAVLDKAVWIMRKKGSNIDVAEFESNMVSMHSNLPETINEWVKRVNVELKTQ